MVAAVCKVAREPVAAEGMVEWFRSVADLAGNPVVAGQAAADT